MDPLACLVVIGLCIVAIIAIVWGRIRAEDNALKARQHAHDAYQASLARLKREPTNADFKQQALQLGRVYANLTREQRDVTMFDEVALSNDICAATAAATASKAAPTSSVEDRLQALEGLRTMGLIAPDEYAQKRQKLIEEM